MSRNNDEKENGLSMQITSQKRLPISMGGHQVIQMKFKGKDTRDKIKEYVQNQSNVLKESGFKGSIMVTLKYPEGWKSGYFAKVGEPVSLYNYLDSDVVEDEVDDFEEFQMYLTKY